MCKIEDILYESHKLGVRAEVFGKMGELKLKEKYKHTLLSEIYELAFNEVINNLNDTKNKTIH